MANGFSQMGHPIKLNIRNLHHLSKWPMFSNQMEHFMPITCLLPAFHLQFYNLPTYLPTYLNVQPIYQPTHLPRCNTYLLPTHLPKCTTYLPAYLMYYLPTYLPLAYPPTYNLPKCITYLPIHPLITYLHIKFLPTYLPTYPHTHTPTWVYYLPTFPHTYLHTCIMYLHTHPPTYLLQPNTFIPHNLVMKCKNKHVK